MNLKVMVSVFVSLLLSACSLNSVPAQAEEGIRLEAQAVAGNRVVNSYGRTSVFGAPPLGLAYTKVEVGTLSAFVLRSDGKILASGADDYCQQRVPVLPAGMRYIDLSANWLAMVALRSDGQVVAWGNDLCYNLPNPPLPKDSTFIAVATSMNHGLALRNNGTIRAWGSNVAGETEVPALPAGVRYTAVDAGSFYSLALRSDGQVVEWGSVGSVPQLPAGLSYTAVSTGYGHQLALRSDGQVSGWGRSTSGQLDVPALPAGLTYTAVAVGDGFSKAIRSDGKVVQWGAENFDHDQALPALPPGSRYVGVAGGPLNSAALVADASAVAGSYNIDLEAVFSKPPVASVAVGRGVVYGGKGKGNANPIQIEGRTPGSTRNRAVVLGKTGNKVLTVVGEDGVTLVGGTLTIAFVPSFTSWGVTVGSLKVAGPAKGMTLEVVAVGGRRFRVPLSPTRWFQTVTLNAAGVGALVVSSPGAFAVDDVVFEESSLR